MYTVEPRLTDTLLKRTPLSNERLWPVPTISPYKSCLKTPPWANNPGFPVERTLVCPPKVFVSEVFFTWRLVLLVGTTRLDDVRIRN